MIYYASLFIAVSQAIRYTVAPYFTSTLLLIEIIYNFKGYDSQARAPLREGSVFIYKWSYTISF
jgi:hypothetical protein